MRMLHAAGKQAGRSHADIRDDGNAQFGITSLTELETWQASVLIDSYLKESQPPDPPAPPPRLSPFGGHLAKRVDKKAPMEAPKPVPSAASRHPALVMPPVGKPVPSPASSSPGPCRPHIPAIDPELEKIPW
jgi:hypothetical protein